VALALPIVVAVPLGLVLGGRLRSLSDFRLRATWLFFVAIGLQVAAFPFGVLPWRTGETAATLLWVASYGLLIAGALVNRWVPGVPLVGAGMAANLAAIAVNGGTMPVLPSAMRAAGDEYVSQANSTAVAHPHLSWLVDRWAAPDWVPFANVFSVGDVLIAVGAVVIVLAAMRVRLPQLGACATTSEV
jgi:Family of unknown function (DUF5317)